MGKKVQEIVGAARDELQIC